jgi:hypothetical protein
VPISIPESLVIALSPILSSSSRTFVELTLVNWRRPWGSRRLDFVIRAGFFKFFCRQDQQILRLPTTEAVRSIQQNLSSTSAIVYIVKIFTASSSRIVEFIQVDGSLEPRKSIYMLLQWFQSTSEDRVLQESTKMGSSAMIGSTRSNLYKVKSKKKKQSVAFCFGWFPSKFFGAIKSDPRPDWSQIRTRTGTGQHQIKLVTIHPSCLTPCTWRYT